MTQALQPLYDPREAAAVAKYYHEHLTGWEQWSLPLHYGDALTEAQHRQRQQDLLQMAQGAPVQYVMEQADFYGRRFQVTPDVLIPRPETEELVLMAIRELSGRKEPKVWDVGTGSGCIAVTIAAEMPGAQVFATDISEKALAVAKGNAARQQVAITFAQHDMRDHDALPFPDQHFDLIISNPPYIPERDRQEMHRNVVEHEPEIALFVPDEDPLRFYQAIGRYATKALKAGGQLFFELNERHANETKELLADLGLANIIIYKDQYGKDRFISACK